MPCTPKILYASSRSHVDQWRPINLHPISAAPTGFIFSTDQIDKNPLVIVDLDLPIDAKDIEIAVWNRDLLKCRERALGFKISTSKDLQNWRKHEDCKNQIIYLRKISPMPTVARR